jgi:hypothetical protein
MGDDARETSAAIAAALWATGLPGSEGTPSTLAIRASISSSARIGSLLTNRGCTVGRELGSTSSCL